MYLSRYYHRGEKPGANKRILEGFPPTSDVKISMSNLIMSTYTNWSDDTFGNRVLNESSNRNLATRRIPDSIIRDTGYLVQADFFWI